MTLKVDVVLHAGLEEGGAVGAGGMSSVPPESRLVCEVLLAGAGVLEAVVVVGLLDGHGRPQVDAPDAATASASTDWDTDGRPTLAPGKWWPLGMDGGTAASASRWSGQAGARRHCSGGAGLAVDCSDVLVCGVWLCTQGVANNELLTAGPDVTCSDEGPSTAGVGVPPGETSERDTSGDTSGPTSSRRVSPTGGPGGPTTVLTTGELLGG